MEIQSENSVSKCSVKKLDSSSLHPISCDTISFCEFVVRWGSFESPDEVDDKLDELRIYEMAMKTWSEWLETHVNRTKTKLFFVSMSPAHDRFVYHLFQYYLHKSRIQMSDDAPKLAQKINWFSDIHA